MADLQNSDAEVNDNEDGFDGFVARLMNALSIIAPTPISPATGLFDELGLGSFAAIEMIVILEDWAVTANIPTIPPTLITLGDAYDYFSRLTATTPASTLENKT